MIAAERRSKSKVLDSLLISIIPTFFCWLIYEWKFKKLLSQYLSTQNNNQDVLIIKLERNVTRQFPKISDDDTKIETSYSMGENETSEQLNEAGWQISNIVNVGQTIIGGTSHQKSSEVKVTLTKKYNLRFQTPNYLKCVETWKIKPESQEKSIGDLVVEWNNTISPNIEQQLTLKYIYFDKHYETHKEQIKRDLLNHLLSNEEEEYVTSLILNNENEQSMIRACLQSSKILVGRGRGSRGSRGSRGGN